jgi:hypothetical protein
MSLPKTFGRSRNNGSPGQIRRNDAPLCRKRHREADRRILRPGSGIAGHTGIMTIDEARQMALDFAKDQWNKVDPSDAGLHCSQHLESDLS